MIDSISLLAFLVAGHTVGDFVLQTRRMALGKGQPRWLLAHASTVTAAHVICLLPVWDGPVIVVALGIGVLHGLVDFAKTRLVHTRVRAERLREAAGEQGVAEPRRLREAAREQRAAEPPRFWPFAVDQIVHLLILLGAALLLSRLPLRPWFPELATLSGGAYLAWFVAAYAFNVNGSSSLVRAVLRRFTPPEAADGEQPGAGRVIGVLERLITLTLVLLDQWGALGFVLAAKSIARFKDLDQRLSAEYYLIGTLMSLALAVASALLLRLLLLP